MALSCPCADASILAINAAHPYTHWPSPFSTKAIQPTTVTCHIARGHLLPCLWLVLDDEIMEYKARRRHVPAFGEWNYYYSPSSASPEEPPELSRYGGAARAAEWWCSPEPEACSDVWFRYSPPPRKPAAAPPKKARRTARPQNCSGGAVKGSVALVREQPGGAGAAAAVAAARAPRKGGSRAVVRPVDEDLYQVPPPDDFVSSGRRPRPKRAGRSLWMGCLGGLGCIA